MYCPNHYCQKNYYRNISISLILIGMIFLECFCLLKYEHSYTQQKNDKEANVLQQILYEIKRFNHTYEIESGLRDDDKSYEYYSNAP